MGYTLHLADKGNSLADVAREVSDGLLDEVLLVVVDLSERQDLLDTVLAELNRNREVLHVTSQTGSDFLSTSLCVQVDVSVLWKRR